MINVAINAAAGKMGRTLVQAVTQTNDLRIASASEAPSSIFIGQDIGLVAGVSPLQVSIVDKIDELLAPAQVVIDFSSPSISCALVAACAKKKTPIVVGTTGLSPEQRNFLVEAGQKTPIVFAPNMSIGVNLLISIVAQVAERLGVDFDTEIVETHHRHKTDAPSGTALRLAEAIASATANEGSLKDRCCLGRQGLIGPRPKSQIGIQTVRGGDVVGDHTVMFCGEGERLEFTHRASSRQTFAQGAIRAARWLINQPAGMYDMQDVLGMK